MNELIRLIKLAQGDRSQNDYAFNAAISSAAITRILSGDRRPTPEILRKLASHAHNGVSYYDLMRACGYLDCDIDDPAKKNTPDVPDGDITFDNILSTTRRVHKLLDNRSAGTSAIDTLKDICQKERSGLLFEISLMFLQERIVDLPLDVKQKQFPDVDFTQLHVPDVFGSFHCNNDNNISKPSNLIEAIEQCVKSVGREHFPYLDSIIMQAKGRSREDICTVADFISFQVYRHAQSFDTILPRYKLTLESIRLISEVKDLDPSQIHELIGEARGMKKQNAADAVEAKEAM